MTHPLFHAQSSVRRFGGKVEDYLPVHDWLDATKEMFCDVRHRALGDVLGQIPASFELRQNEEDADQMAEDRGRGALDVQLGPHQELDLGGQVVDRLIALDHGEPDGDIVPEEGLGCPGQGFRHHREELGDPHFDAFDLLESRFHDG